jgi:hypothetical protein
MGLTNFNVDSGGASSPVPPHWHMVSSMLATCLLRMKRESGIASSKEEAGGAAKLGVILDHER